VPGIRFAAISPIAPPAEWPTRITRLNPNSLDHGFHIRGLTRSTPLFALLARLAGPGLIEGDDAVVGGELIDLILPVLAVAAPAVQEHQRGVALAADVTHQIHPVTASDGLFDGFVRGFTAENSRRQQQTGDGRPLCGTSRVHRLRLHRRV